MNAKDNIAGIFENNGITFNREFDLHFEQLKDDMKTSVFIWCKKVQAGEIPHIPIATKKYRDWVVFIDKIADKRVLAAKIKNGKVVEIHLSDHKYYDEQRRRFGIKKGSKYY